MRDTHRSFLWPFSLAIVALVVLASPIAGWADSVTIPLTMRADCVGGICDQSDGRFGVVTVEDGIVNRFSGDPNLPLGELGLRITVHSILPLSDLMFGGTGIIMSASNDFVVDGVSRPITLLNHLPSDGGEFFSGGTNANNGPFGHFGSRLAAVTFQHDLVFDIFAVTWDEDRPLTLADAVSLSDDFYPVATSFPPMPARRAVVQGRVVGTYPVNAWVAGTVPAPPGLLLVAAGCLLAGVARRRSQWRGSSGVV